MPETNAAFVSTVPQIYDEFLGHTLFLPCAVDLAQRLPVRTNAVLELACGTGILTSELIPVLKNEWQLISTDLDERMLQLAIDRLYHPRLQLRQADAMALPFENAGFDLVVCQHGVMFFPDKAAAAAEVRRVLKPDGTYLFNVWAGLEENPLVKVAQRVVDRCYPENPPDFYRAAWGYCDQAQIERDLRSGGFSDIRIETVETVGLAQSARHAAIGLVQGTPMRHAIEQRGTLSPDHVASRVADAMFTEFGYGPLDTTLRVLAVTAR